MERMESKSDLARERGSCEVKETKKRWMNICNLLYRFHDLHYQNVSSKFGSAIVKVRKGIVSRSFKEFCESGETLINFPRFQIVLQSSDTHNNLLLKFTRYKNLDRVLDETKDFLAKAGYEIVEKKRGEYLLTKTK